MPGAAPSEPRVSLFSRDELLNRPNKRRASYLAFSRFTLLGCFAFEGRRFLYRFAQIVQATLEDGYSGVSKQQEATIFG